jgi:hypothetical protein
MMAKVEYINEPLPNRDEFRRALQEAREAYDPVEELLRLYRELSIYEQRYGISSKECYERFTSGQMGDDPDIFAWVGRYKAFVRIKSAITEGLNVVVHDPYAATA